MTHFTGHGCQPSNAALPCIQFLISSAAQGTVTNANSVPPSQDPDACTGVHAGTLQQTVALRRVTL
jgi:hypothetical protein